MECPYSCHMQAKYNLPILFLFREAALKCVELKTTRAKYFSTFWIVIISHHTPQYGDRNNLQVLAFAAICPLLLVNTMENTIEI